MLIQMLYAAQYVHLCALQYTFINMMHTNMLSNLRQVELKESNFIVNKGLL